ncbi:MAG: CoA-binding protein [Candidatus Micrarchaeota archaeon]|nr:CoA-binding protein [Candidatus Micrarchaeota archaeon]
MTGLDLKPMLKPRSVAIIGASRDPDKVGHVILQNYINAGYSGKIYVVNNKADEIMGIKAYRNIRDIKAGIDLAVIAIPAEFVPDALEDCGKAGVKTTIVVSGGFAEIGKNDLQERLVQVARKYNMPTLGPNCLGVMDPRSRIDTLFLPTYKLSRPSVGGVSFVSQSGAVGSTILDLISSEGFGLSKFISYGNAAHIDEIDVLDYLMHDDETKVVIMYIEGIRRGREFLEAAKRISRVKPVIVLKGGKTAVGMAAARSHTAALAGDAQAYEAVFRQAGFIIADDISELLYYAKIMESEVPPAGNRVAIITNGGGAGVLATDAVGMSGKLKLAELSKKTIGSLAKIMPSLVNVRNPLDVAGDADEKRYGSALSLLMQDGGVDMFLVIALFQTPGADSKLAARLVDLKQKMEKPLVVVSIGAEYTKMHRIIMESGGVPVYDSPVDAVKSLAALYSYYTLRKARSKSNV